MSVRERSVSYVVYTTCFVKRRRYFLENEYCDTYKSLFSCLTNAYECPREWTILRELPIILVLGAFVENYYFRLWCW